MIYLNLILSTLALLGWLSSSSAQGNGVGAEEEGGTFDMLMPGVTPTKDEDYLCTAFEMPADQALYVTGFTPHGSQMTAHHMLIYGCDAPGSFEEEVWDCGEMAAGPGRDVVGPCDGAGQSEILYGWAKDAPALQLPEGVGFKVGGPRGKQYLVLQVHYMHKMDHSDSSGITLHISATPQPREAGVLLLGTGGTVPPHSHTRMDTACEIDEPVRMHPFAFRTHTHKLGVRVSGYRVRGDAWTLVGTHDPQQPQMFYPTTEGLEVTQGDVMAAQCCMVNNLTHPVAIGPTGADEMCNFYMMYWVEAAEGGPLGDNMCFSPGPPYYSWERAGLVNVPDDKC